MLEDPDVAGHQRRRDESNGLPEREVPRHHRQHHPERLPAGVSALRADLRRLGRLVGQELLGVLGVITETLGALEHFSFGRLEGLTHLEGHHRPDVVGFLLEQVSGGVRPLGALRERGVAIVEEALVSAADRRLDVAVGGGVEGFDCLAGGRVDSGDGHGDILRLR